MVLSFVSKHTELAHSISKFKHRHENQEYSSFVIKLPAAEAGKFLCEDIWPKDILVKKFYRELRSERIEDTLNCSKADS